MKVYALSDLHLSFMVNKPMDVFGEHWDNYEERVKENVNNILTSDDILLIAGDISWAMNMPETQKDFEYIASLNGKKIIIRGNHDYWWKSITRIREVLPQNVYALQNDAIKIGSYVICGTRGWFYDEQKAGSHDEKIFRRELGRLERSLQLAGEKEKYCFLHYPPRYRGYVCPEILALFETYGVTRCYYGHLHADSIRLALEDDYQGVQYRLVSADHVDFQPQRIG